MSDYTHYVAVGTVRKTTITKEEIIAMARKAGFEQLGPDIEDWVCFTDEIELFAALIAAHEREACAKVCESAIENATDWDSSYWDQACEDRATAIRARGETK